MSKTWRGRWGIALTMLAIAAAGAGLKQAGDEAQEAVQTAAAGERILIPGGQAVGVALRTQGVLVVAGKAAGGNGLREGDVILAADGHEVNSAQQLAAYVQESVNEQVCLEVLRSGKAVVVEASAPIDGADGQRRLGVWVRDSTAGVGTLTYIDPQSGAYGGLGHAIVDADTGEMLTVQDGAVLQASVVGVVRGERGKAGELRGSFLKEGVQIGSLNINSDCGIYGTLREQPDALVYPQGLPVGGRHTAHSGPATILSTVDENGPCAYEIEIVRCLREDEPGQKGMVLRVTDERLLAKTGGIVQGMSGSPIIQDGKLIGAVTHVLNNLKQVM